MARLLAMTLDLRPTRRDQPKITPVEEPRGGAGSRVERARAGARKAGAGGRERGQKVSERGPKGSGADSERAQGGRRGREREERVSERGPKGAGAAESARARAQK
jgi:hypothetical protein